MHHEYAALFHCQPECVCVCVWCVKDGVPRVTGPVKTVWRSNTFYLGSVAGESVVCSKR